MLEEDAVKKLIIAGRMAKRAREYAYKLVKPGIKMLDLATKIENYIREIGGELAFPVNIGINHVAAHYTPVHNDPSIIPEGAVVKVDIGVHVDGYIADTAFTTSFNPAHHKLLEATELALEKALSAVRPGVKAFEVGKIIEDSIKSAGFKPIRNLGGHGIERYSIHSGLVIPNCYDLLCRYRLDSGVYAIEPFATNGVGLVREAGIVTIYALRSSVEGVSPLGRTVYDIIYRERRGLPFTPRWYINRVLEAEAFSKALTHLSKAGCLLEYPVLVERSNGVVAQFEHTIVVMRSEVIITTI